MQGSLDSAFSLVTRLEGIVVRLLTRTVNSFSSDIQIGLGSYPHSCSVSTRWFARGYNGRGVKLATHFEVPKLGKSGCLPLFLPYRLPSLRIQNEVRCGYLDRIRLFQCRVQWWSSVTAVIRLRRRICSTYWRHPESQRNCTLWTELDAEVLTRACFLCSSNQVHPHWDCRQKWQPPILRQGAVRGGGGWERGHPAHGPYRHCKGPRRMWVLMVLLVLFTVEWIAGAVTVGWMRVYRWIGGIAQDLISNAKMWAYIFKFWHHVFRRNIWERGLTPKSLAVI